LLGAAVVLCHEGSSKAAEPLRSLFDEADVIELDPAQCHTSTDGTLYVALGQHVFRWPLADLPIFRKLRPPQDTNGGPNPPDPEEPRGCAGNPYPVQAITFDMAADGTRLAAEKGDEPAAVVGIFLTPIPVEDWRASLKFRDNFFRLVCLEGATHMPQGLVRCSIRKVIDVPQKKWNKIPRTAMYFKAPPDIYAAPLGGTFYISCPAVPEFLCSVDYALHEEGESYVELYYEFLRTRLQVSRFPEFDQTLRAMLAAAEVKDFVWR
jgi:hypothetical protein